MSLQKLWPSFDQMLTKEFGVFHISSKSSFNTILVSLLIYIVRAVRYLLKGGFPNLTEDG